MIRRRAAHRKLLMSEGGNDHERGHESSRVRPDHVSCCIVHFSPGSSGAPQKGHADSSALEQSRVDVGLSSDREHPSGATSSDRPEATDEGISGRGSHVRFTPCMVSRSWLFEDVRISSNQRRTVSERDRDVRGGVASPRSTRRRRSDEAGHHHQSAQRRRETPSAPVLPEGTRKPRGSGCPFDSRDGQKSVVRIFGSSIRGVATHRGPPAGLATGALT